MLQDCCNNCFRCIFLNEVAGLGNSDELSFHHQLCKPFARCNGYPAIFLTPKNLSGAVKLPTKGFNFIRVLLIHLRDLPIKRPLPDVPSPRSRVNLQSLIG